jgi:hypothetical protein
LCSIAIRTPDGDFEPDGSPYTMISLSGDLYVAEANSGQILRVSTGGEISRVIDLSVNHPVPTAITFHEGLEHDGRKGAPPQVVFTEWLTTSVTSMSVDVSIGRLAGAWGLK